MDFILENIYWLVFAAAGLVQWWKSTKEAKEAEEEARRNPPEPVSEEWIEDGEWVNPRPAVPPPLPRAAPPPALRRNLAQEPPVVPVNSGELERQAKLAEQMRLLKQVRRGRSREEAPFPRESANESPVEAAVSLRGRLRNRREIRQAFVLKEILDKPIGLR